MKHLLIFLLVTVSSLACQVPVFRYALERWQPDSFRLQLIHRGEAPPELTIEPKHLNLEFESLSMDKLTPNERFAIVGLEKLTEYPAFLLHPPESWENTEPLVFPGTRSALESILDSPLRHRIKNNLLNGESTVWVLVEGTDQTANEATFNLLNDTLQEAAKNIQIPQGVIQADQIGKVGEDINLDDVLRSSIPLKISFKIERIKRSDPAEQTYLRILTANRNSPPEEPLVVPIFGRGRTPGPLPGSSITAETVTTACEYLCGACSCQVKSGNPGYDLLFKANWQEKLQSGLVVIDKSLPTVLPSLNDESLPDRESPEERSSLKSYVVNFPNTLLLAIPMILLIGTIFLLKKSK
ncbi:MAG: hypothetical protein P8M04_04555 [Akkermansiaceae bacterium]|nr:hypothetical protein [Akkermansiaceae bacterium]